jgi:hypothetical protein
MSTDDNRKIEIKLKKLVDTGTANNYGGCEVKWRSKLDAYGLWSYIEGPRPDMPELKEDRVQKGLKEGTTEEVTFVIKGNRERWEQAQKDNAPWIEGNKRALSAIIDAIPDHKLYLVKDTKYARDAWKALKNEYKPMNARTIVQVKQELLSGKCASHSSADVEKWLVWMIAKKQALHDVDPSSMTDTEFARHLITLMPQTGKWTYLSNELSRAMTKDMLDGQKLTSMAVINAMRDQMKVNDRGMQEEAVMNAMSSGKRTLEQAYYTSQTNPNANKRLRVENYGSTSNTGSSGGVKWCINRFCKRPKGHLQADCIAFGGGKAGQYPDWWRGPRDIHLHPSQRADYQGGPAGRVTPGPRPPPTVFYTHGQYLQSSIQPIQPGTYPQQYPVYQVPYQAPYHPLQIVGGSPHPAPSQAVTPAIAAPSTSSFTTDSSEHASSIVGPEKIFIVDGTIHSVINDLDDVVESVNKLVLTGGEKTNDSFWDTGATRGVFHDRAVFRDYRVFAHPIQVNGFGSNLATIARAVGTVDMRSWVDNKEDRWTLTDVLHIPDARCNLISGIRLDYKGVFAVAGDQKVALYIKGSSTPFAIGDIQNDLYRLHAEPIVQPVPVMSSLTITPDLPANQPSPPEPSTSGSSQSDLPTLGSAGVMNVEGKFDEGVFAVPSLASMYEQPSEEEKQKFFGTV